MNQTESTKLSSFGKKMMELEKGLKGYAYSLTMNSDRAKDLVQETFLKALTYRDKYTDDTNLKAWMYTIMRNTFINDYHRSSKTQNSVSGTNTDFVMQSAKDMIYPSPDSLYSYSEIEKSIAQLEEEYKVPFNMFLEGYKYKEIADILGMPLGTVKSRIFFTRKKLTSSLKDFV